MERLSFWSLVVTHYRLLGKSKEIKWHEHFEDMTEVIYSNRGNVTVPNDKTAFIPNYRYIPNDLGIGKAHSLVLSLFFQIFASFG